MIHFKVIAKWKLLPGISWKWWLTTKINRTITILHVCIHAPLWSVFENQVGSPNIFAWYSLLKDFMRTIFQFNIFQFLSALGENMTIMAIGDGVLAKCNFSKECHPYRLQSCLKWQNSSPEGSGITWENA